MIVNLLAQKRKNILLNQAPTRNSQVQTFDDFYYEQVAKISGVGGWWVNFEDKKSFIDPQGRKILRLPADYQPSLRTTLQLYAPEHRSLAQENFMLCTQGKSFDVEIKMLPYQAEAIWVHAYGSAILNEEGKVVGVRGVFRNIDKEKKETLHLKKSLAIIESQNSRLFHFAHIVSHHLRSHANNLDLSLELLKDATSREDQRDLLENIEAISKELTDSVSHLSEISASQNKCKDSFIKVSFSEALKKVISTLQTSIADHQVEIFSDFSEIPEIEYIPCYLENFLMNFITNAIKFKHPSRDPSIQIFSYFEEDRPCLMFKDNGVGIDLAKDGEKLFHLYETFHDHPEEIGVGLFIVKNQVEALGGSIEVESDLNRGTIFRIYFK